MVCHDSKLADASHGKTYERTRMDTGQEQNLSDLEQTLLSKIPRDGSTRGNRNLRRALGWQEEQYWDVRDSLEDRGLIERGRGKGGSVRRAVSTTSLAAAEESTSTPTVESEASRVPESELYEPIAQVLKSDWVKDRRFDKAIVQITAQQGRRSTGGKWSRPDVAVATLSTYTYVPGKHFDVVTFEVKPADMIDVTAVYEALAHLRFATRAYVLLCVPDERDDALQSDIDEVVVVARKQGVGVITVGHPSNYDTWEELVESERFEHDPQRLNEFLTKQFNAEQKEELVRWFR